MAKVGRPRKTNLRPIDDNIENDSIEMDYDDINQSSEQENIPEGKIRVENNIDFFNTNENDPDFSNDTKDNDISKYEQEISELTEKINSLKNENSVLKMEKTRLLNEISELKTNIENISSKIMDQDAIKSIQDENDNLLLKNSELELELSKMRCQLRDNISSGKPSATQVYSREQYTPMHGNVINRKNGYQDWN